MDALVTALVEFFNHTISQELTVLVISMLPILELRGGMLAAALLGVDRVQAFFICLFGTDVYKRQPLYASNLVRDTPGKVKFMQRHKHCQIPLSGHLLQNR